MASQEVSEGRESPLEPAISAEEAVALLRTLVRTRTVNPPGDEAAAAAIVAARLRAAGFAVELPEAQPGRPSVVGRLKGREGGPRLLFNGHLDTLPPGSGWRRDPFEGVVKNGRLYGCGATDMKAGVAAMVLAACAVAREGTPFRGELIVTAVPDEIAGGIHGTGYLVKSGAISADMAVVCEPTGPRVFVAHRGALWLEITVTGKSAHGGRPWLGVSAISKMARLIRALEAELPPLFRTKTHPLLPSPSLNIGTIQGGDRVNMVADRCVVHVDRRLLPGERAEDALEEIRRVVDRVVAEDPEEWSASVWPYMVVDPAEVNPEERIVRECRRAYEEVTGEPCGLGVTPGFEDAHYLIHAGIPTAMFGPYVPGDASEPFSTLAGTADEHVEIARVVQAAEVYRRLCHNLLGGAVRPLRDPR